jgi:hypothetical protein
MFCQSCGSSCNESANFCITCGRALNDSSSKHHAFNSTNAKSTTSGPSTSQPMSFKAYMESRLSSQDQDASFTTIKKRKTEERTQCIKKKTPKSDIVQVCIYVL